MAGQQPSDPPEDSSSLPQSPSYGSKITSHRTVSHGAQWIPTDIPSHHNAGTSYSSQYSVSISPSPRRKPIRRSSSGANSRRLRVRTTSVGSSRVRDRDGGLLSEDDEEDPEEAALGVEQGDDVRGKRAAAAAEGSSDHTTDEDAEDEDPITLKDRQSLINVEHPFGLPIWKPALYKKSRSVTRYADQALHSIPSAQAERHLLPGNILWAVFFGWWLAVVCFVISALLWIVPRGGRRYSSLVYGLGWYLGWPFGKYVEGHIDEPHQEGKGDPMPHGDSALHTQSGSDNETIRGPPSHLRDRPDDDSLPRGPSIHFTPPDPQPGHTQSSSWSDVPIPDESSSLLGRHRAGGVPLGPSKSYGATNSSVTEGPIQVSTTKDFLGRVCFWLALVTVIAPLMLLVCIVCWALIVAIPMAKLNWALIKHLFQHPTSIRFCSAPSIVYLPAESDSPLDADAGENGASTPMRVKPRLWAGQDAPSGAPSSKVLLCIYRAMGWKFYKYTIGGVNIFFINLLPIVFFVIFDGWFLFPIVEERERTGQPVPAILALLGSRLLIFLLSLLSVIPLSYFIGMAVASISAQSSIGMGAVINATFGSIIEIILYAFALTEGKGRLVEGSIVGSLLAGVLLMPGMSMISVALRRKEQSFNAKSAGVTSTMLIMAIIGTLTPTLFYQTYGNFQLVCKGCPDHTQPGHSWKCRHCSYQHPDPVKDPFYQSTVKSLMYFCAGILLFSYLVGLWFSLRTHASQIWQNPQQLLHPHESGRMSLYHKIAPPSNLIPGVSKPGPRDINTVRAKPNVAGADAVSLGSHSAATAPQSLGVAPTEPSAAGASSSAPSGLPRSSFPNPPVSPTPGSLVPILESVDHALKDAGLQPGQLPADDFTRAVAVATVSALRHQQVQARRVRSGQLGDEEDPAAHGGHDAPSWSRAVSASVLLACTALYAVIAELLVDVVDVVLNGSGIDEKFLGVTLFALVPNTTEFMNAMSFAMNGNIALSMEIGSAYALQVCLLQIPAMVAFSAWYDPAQMGKVADTFTLIFPRWDVIVIILSIFLLTYTYIEAKANYHRGSILVLSYLVLTAGFFFAPHHPNGDGEESVTTLGPMVTVRTLTESLRLYWAAP